MPSIKRHERMTEADRERKLARQFARRMGSSTRGNMRYRLGTEEYWAAYHHFFEVQGGKCKICDKLHVDHNHETGQVRGLLCSSCNTSLGLIQEDRVVIMRMLKYLKDNQ